MIISLTYWVGILFGFFGVKGNPQKAPSLKQVDWTPPLCGWVKVNTNGVSRGSPKHVARRGIFRDKSDVVLGCFSSYLGITSSLQAELSVTMFAIEVAYQRGWHRLWLECDSSLVIYAFSISNLVPWRLHNRWKNCLLLTSAIQWYFHSWFYFVEFDSWFH